MSNLFNKALLEATRRENQTSPLLAKALQAASAPKITLQEFRENPSKFDVMEFQPFKKKRQKEHPMPKGRPKDPNYISHKKAYEEYIRTEYEIYIKGSEK